MGRSGKEKKSKTGIKIWFPIMCVVIVIIAFCMIHDIQNRIENGKIKNSVNNENVNNIRNELLNEENIVSNENIIENTINNTIENEVNNNASKNTTTNKVQNQNSGSATPGITDKKQKAIELVKKEWGADDSVNYAFDYINENGEYVIAVKDKASATVKYYFRVNLETETVELD